MKHFVHRISVNIFFCSTFLTIQEERRNLSEKLEHLSALGNFIFFFIHLFVFGRNHENLKFPYSTRPSWGILYSSFRKSIWGVNLISPFSGGITLRVPRLKTHPRLRWNTEPGLDIKANKGKRQLALMRVVPKLFHIYSIKSYSQGWEYSSLI